MRSPVAVRRASNARSADGSVKSKVLVTELDCTACTPERRLARLRALSASLARPGLATEAIAEVLVDGACSAIGATRGAVHVVDVTGTPRLAASYGPPLDPGTALVVPLVSDGSRVGALALANDDGRAFDEDDRAFVAVLAQQVAHALHRAAIVERDRRYHERMRILTDAGELLAGTIDYEQTLHNVVRIALPALGDFCFVDILEADVVRRIANAYDDRETLALLSQTRWTPPARPDMDVCALSSGRTGFHPQIDDAWMQLVAARPEELDVLRRLELRSMITAPLVSGGERIGALTVCFGRSGRAHHGGDIALVEELARRAAVALKNASLFRTARDAMVRAEEASRLKDEFLATVSHELRTPLSSILGWSTLLRNDRAEPELLRRGLEVIERNARAQQRIIEDILDVSRIITGKLRIDTEPVDLTMLFESVLESVRPTAFTKSIELAFTGPATPCRVAGDSVRLRQVFWNLLSNALKFTPEGGRVNMSMTQAGDRVFVRIEDSGCGMTREFIAHAFDRFRQADSSTTRQHGGLGLGLAIVRHLAEMHGGAVTASSGGPGCGSTFTVVLPIRPFSAPVAYTPPREDPGERPATPSQRRALAAMRVLVVEDEPDSRELIHVLLESEGAEVRSAASADEALAVLDAFEADVVLSDIGMPGKDGLWLAASLRETRRDLPLVALTAYSGSDDIARAIAAGFDQHVAKPVDTDQLVDALRTSRRPRISAA
jgi:signal transduction histidine kinase/CheY-like chemotaxis protein